MNTKENIPLNNYTTFKIGGKARYFLEVEGKDDLIEAVSLAKKMKLPLFVLGAGSNLLVSDKGFNGAVIKMQNANLKIQNDNAKLKIICGAGTMLGELVNFSAKNSLSGLEWASGIPGTLGGAVRGNAGAFGSSMADIVTSVEILDVKSLKFKKIKNKNCQFDYRQSIFKKNKNLIIFSVTLKLKKEGKKKILEKIKEYLNYRKERHPKDPSAGSVFKNQPGFFARDLILKCGLAGKIIGGGKISEQHPNFILNFNNAKAKDVKKLIKLIKKSVKNKFGIDLKEEIVYL